MTIFNNLKRGATDAANKAAKKTGEITNIAKLTMNIKNAETKLGDVYEEIGRLFYTAERTGEDCTSEIAANIMKADKIKADIAAATAVGKLVAERALEKGIDVVVFDRGGYLYHGRVKALAEGARSAGLEF